MPKKSCVKFSSWLKGYCISYASFSHWTWTVVLHEISLYPIGLMILNQHLQVLGSRASSSSRHSCFCKHDDFIPRDSLTYWKTPYVSIFLLSVHHNQITLITFHHSNLKPPMWPEKPSYPLFYQYRVVHHFHPLKETKSQYHTPSHLHKKIPPCNQTSVSSPLQPNPLRLNHLSWYINLYSPLCRSLKQRANVISIHSLS